MTVFIFNAYILRSPMAVGFFHPFFEFMYPSTCNNVNLCVPGPSDEIIIIKIINE